MPTRRAVSATQIFIRICQHAHIPYLAVHDRDALPERRPIRGERILNARPVELAGADHMVELAPDFEAVAALHGHGHKPARAWERFSTQDPAGVPEQLREIVERLLEPRLGKTRGSRA